MRLNMVVTTPEGDTVLRNAQIVVGEFESELDVVIDIGNSKTLIIHHNSMNQLIKDYLSKQVMLLRVLGAKLDAARGESNES